MKVLMLRALARRAANSNLLISSSILIDGHWPGVVFNFGDGIDHAQRDTIRLLRRRCNSQPKSLCASQRAGADCVRMFLAAFFIPEISSWGRAKNRTKVEWDTSI
jgi:hypothetical protein